MAEIRRPEERGACDESTERWRREAAFFDSEEYAEGPIPAVIIRRYLSVRKPWFPAEFPFSLMSNVEGKRILELGCGSGGNSILLALKGGRVWGIDLSNRAIQIAERRAVLHGVADRAQFVCAPIEVYAESEREPFDVIAGWAVLHHMLPVLDSVLTALKKLSHRDTVFIFSEPIATWRWLRRLRLALPIPIHGTPDERPLNGDDLAILRRHFPGLQTRCFGAAVRVVSRLIPDHYETSRFARFCWDATARFDNALLRLPGAKGLASTATFYCGPDF